MKHITAILGFGIAFSAALLTLYGVHLITDVQVYQSILFYVLQDTLLLGPFWVLVAVVPFYVAVKIFDRGLFARVNDPLLI